MGPEELYMLEGTASDHVPYFDYFIQLFISIYYNASYIYTQYTIADFVD